MFDKNKLLDKCEAMTLLCTKASTHWSFIKFCFNIPLVITSSAMCIINSISEDANAVKIPNIVVNAVSVLIMSLNNSIKAGEKFETFILNAISTNKKQKIGLNLILSKMYYIQGSIKYRMKKWFI